MGPVGDRPPPRRRVESAQDFQELTARRVENLLLVASPYDCFILEEDGQLNERMIGEFLELGLRHTPGLTRISSGAEAVERAVQDPRFNLVVAALQVGDMNAVELVQALRARGVGVPVVMLAFDGRQLNDFLSRTDISTLERVFLWQGDVGILLAIVKSVEDRWNAPRDCGEAGVPVLLVVEDSIRYYSSFLPIIYAELIHHMQRLLPEGLNVSQKMLRMRARPKVLLATTFEEAWELVVAYQESLLALISDVEFPMGGAIREDAGVMLARRVRELEPDTAIVLQSSKPEAERLAQEVEAGFLLKGSPLLLSKLRLRMVEDFGFGDFVFRMPDRTSVGRAADLKSLEAALRTVPFESILYHAERNHFSRWLRARADLRVAEKLRPRKVSDYSGPEGLRQDLIRSIQEYRDERRAGTVADLDPMTFDGSPGFYRLGGGSLGGKARGLAFVRRLLADSELDRRFPGIRVAVPSAVVVGTDVFDQFLEQNELRNLVLDGRDEATVHARVMEASFPTEAIEGLRAFAQRVRYPLAIRSSSLLEDSQHQPFSGVYETYMLANAHPDAEVRLDALLRAVKGVYASTFSQRAKAYLGATPYRLEEEKMAVILQRLVGVRRGDRFYPGISGVARTLNYYPTPPMRSEDGIVAVALGLGRTVVEGGECLRFCPRYPRNLIQFSSVADMLKSSQRTFWALKLEGGHLGMDPDQEMREEQFDLAAAERDGTLAPVASTYSSENAAVYDGLSRPGVRLVTFAPMLKHGAFPLAAITRAVLDVGAEGMAGPVEIEFAADIQGGPGEPKEFGFLQIRPLVPMQEAAPGDIAEVDPRELVCRSSSVLGNGQLDGIRDLVVVDFHRFERSQSAEVAREVARFNAELVEAARPYVLVGVGRWGSKDPWLGIPVPWEQISGARVIVESAFRDFRVAPSQGSHFFQNLTAFHIGYFTVDAESGFIDWAWLSEQPAAAERACVRHLRFDAPLSVRMDGRSRQGIILKPRLAPNANA